MYCISCHMVSNWLMKAHEVYGTIYISIVTIWWNYFNVWARLHFYDFYCVFLFIFTFLFRCMSLCVYVWAMLPDSNKTMMMMIYRWCMVVSGHCNMMNPRLKMSRNGLSPSATFSTEGHHISNVTRTTMLHLFCRMTNHTHPFNGPFSRTTRVGRYQKGKTNLDFTEARDSEWQ